MNDFNFLTTHVGSLPHTQLDGLPERLTALLDVPAWPQLPRRSFRESMYVQFSPSLPAVCEDSAREKLYFETNVDLSEALEAFYTPIVADDVEAFALRPGYAQGFFSMLEALRSSNGTWAKGQVTGPISFGLTVTDQD